MHIAIPFSASLKMLDSRNKNLESLVEKYKGPGYCNSRYHGNADICFNVRSLILEFQSRLSFYLTKADLVTQF